MIEIVTGDQRREPESDTPRRTLYSPEVAVHLPQEVTRDGWTVRATWYLHRGDAQLPVGPERIEVWLSPDADDETRHRGLNSTVLRRTIEPALVGLIRQVAEPGQTGSSVAEQLPQARDSLYRNTRAALAELPRPRDNAEGYYGTLLATYERIKASGADDPVGVLQEALSPSKANPVPRGTVLSRLRKARKVMGVHQGLE
jgi:hypothetical protein